MSRACGIFSTGADMNNAYAWYGEGATESGKMRRPSQRRRLLVDRKTFDFYHAFHAHGTNLQFDDGDFNFVKIRSEHGTKRAFELRDAHFEVPEQ
jgi:hypothetical protein